MPLKNEGNILSKNNDHCYDFRNSHDEGAKNRAVNFDFRWQQAPRLKILWVPRQHYTSSFD